jgi:hypothetical protein
MERASDELENDRVWRNPVTLLGSVSSSGKKRVDSTGIVLVRLLSLSSSLLVAIFQGDAELIQPSRDSATRDVDLVPFAIMRGRKM